MASGVWCHTRLRPEIGCSGHMGYTGNSMLQTSKQRPARRTRGWDIPGKDLNQHLVEKSVSSFYNFEPTNLPGFDITAIAASKNSVLLLLHFKKLLPYLWASFYWLSLVLCANHAKALCGQNQTIISMHRPYSAICLSIIWFPFWYCPILGCWLLKVIIVVFNQKIKAIPIY